MTHDIRRLDAADAPGFRALRLDALRLHPAAFGSSFEEESQYPPDEFARRLLSPPAVTFGGFVDGTLAGLAGLIVPTRIKKRHRGDVFGVYVDAAQRRSGLAHALVATVIAHARNEGLCLLQLTVTVGNNSARAMYERLGFTAFAIERRALLVDGVFHDTTHMVLNLD